MSGVAVIVELLLAYGPLTDDVGAGNIVGDDLPGDNVDAAVSVHQVASVDRKVLKAGAVVRVTDRVEAMIHAKDTSIRDRVARLVKRACADKIGNFAGVTAVSVLTEGQGADFTGDTGLRLRMQEFRVSYNEETAQPAPPPPFTPASLFGGGVIGVWYDPSNLSTMYQDVAGTTPAVVNAPVARINDLSGGLRHAFNATTAARPMLRQDGARFYLEFDGIDDFLRATFPITDPFTRISGLMQITWADQDRFFGASGTGTGGELLQRTTSPRLALNISTSSATGSNADAAVGVPFVASEYYAAAGQRLTINNGVATQGVAGLSPIGGLTIGANRFGTNNANIRFYGAVMIARDLTEDETLDARYFMAGKSGVSL